MERIMNDHFRIEFEWLSREDGEAEERATLAELSIAADGHLVMEVEDLFAKTVRKSSRLSALYLARWLAGNWWRLRWEPEETSISWQMSHKIGAAGGGYVWPDLAFSSDGETVLVRARPTPVSEAQPIRYLSNFDKFIPASDFEKGVDDFIEATIARLSSDMANESELTALWKEILDERRDPEAAKWRKLEAFMGLIRTKRKAI